MFTYVQREDHMRVLLWSLLDQFLQKTELYTTINTPSKASKLTELMAFAQNLLGTLQNYDSLGVHVQAQPQALLETFLNPEANNESGKDKHDEIAEDREENDVNNGEGNISNSNNINNGGGVSLLDDLMSSNALNQFKDKKKPVPPPAPAVPTSSQQPAYYSNMDILIAPDVQPRYHHVLPVSSTSGAANNISKSHRSGSEDDGMLSQSNKLKMNKKFMDGSGGNDILQDRLLRAQQAFASLREPAVTNTMTASSANLANRGANNQNMYASSRK